MVEFENYILLLCWLILIDVFDVFHILNFFICFMFPAVNVMMSQRDVDLNCNKVIALF